MKSTEAKQKRNPQKTREKILKCATECFSRTGYRGTSLNDILAKAKVNKRMVYHYFGSKESLYRAVHIQQWKLLGEWITESIIDFRFEREEINPEIALLHKTVEIFHEFCASHQIFVRLLLWDGLEGGDVSRSIWEEIRGPLYHQIETLFKNARQQGYIKESLKIDHLIVSFLGAILFYFAYANSLEDIFGKKTLDSEALEERKSEVIKQFQTIFLQMNHT